MFTETDLYPQDFSRDIVRRIVAGIDKAVFALLGIVYQLFFSVASADIFSTGVISKFYSRVQLIIGVFVLFQLAMTILRGIVNPDGFTDSKSGAGNIVMRICTALVMLALIVPINIPSASNEFEKQINNNGLLFGTLYSLQHRILSNNTIGRVVMGVGNNKDDTNFMSGTDNESLKEASNVFTSTILKGFYRINLIPEKDRKTDGDKEADQINYNRVCRSIDQNVIDEYKKINANPGTIIGFINETCSIDPELKSKYNIQTDSLTGNKLYVFNFMPVVSSLIALIFVVVLLSFCVDVAMRAIKLAVLRLLAPIPIINYMDPKGGKDGAFGAWTKALTSTYLDLFIRIASVYFVIYMIQQMLVHGITTSSTGTVKSFTVIFIWIGLFYFAKEAPKFIKQVLGIKDDGGSGIFSGLGKVMGLGAVAAGAVSGGIAAGIANKSLVRGIGGAIGGGVNAGRDLWKQDKPNASAIMAANRARAMKRYSNAADESTAWGRFKAGVQSDLGMKNEYQQMEDKIKYFGAAGDAMGRINRAFDGNGAYKFEYGKGITDKVKKTLTDKGYDYTKYFDESGNLTDGKGNILIKSGTKYSLKDMNDILGRVQATGDNTLITAVDESKKNAQGARLDTLRTMDRAEIERRVNSTAEEDKEWISSDLNAYDAAYTIYQVAQKYPDDPNFAPFKGKEFDDPDANLGWGNAFKFSASKAKDSAEALKNSPGYFEAKANAERAADSKKS